MPTLQLGVGYPVVNASLVNANFGSRYFFFTFEVGTLAPFSQLNITVQTSVADALSAVFINTQQVASPENACVLASYAPQQSTDYLVDSCTLSTLGQYENSINWFLSVEPAAYNSDVSFTVLAQVLTVDSLALPYNTGNSSTVYQLSSVGQVQYFQFPSPLPAGAAGAGAGALVAQMVNLSVHTVQGGELDFSYALDQLPYLACVGAHEPLCSTAYRCDMFVSNCSLASGTYYVGVRATRLYSATEPLSFMLSIANLSMPSPATLTVGSTLVYQTPLTDYRHFALSTGKSKLTGDTWLDVLLYVDSVDTPLMALYVNADQWAGAGCFQSLQQCQTSGNGACMVSVNSCDFGEHTRWYASVAPLAVAGVYSGAEAKFTVGATLGTPVSLAQVGVIRYDAVYVGQYRQYVLQPQDAKGNSLLVSGASFSVTVACVGAGNLTVFVNYNQLAGSSCDTHQCYGVAQAQQQLSTGRTTTLQFRNCPGSWNADTEIFLSVLGQVQGTRSLPVSYTLVLQQDSVPLQPLQSLAAGQLVSASLASAAATGNWNYTIALPSKMAAGTSLLLTMDVNWGSAGSGGSLQVTLADSNLFQCPAATFVCTVSSATLSYCRVLLQPCQLSSSSTWMVSVTGQANTLFNLQYTLGSDATTTLTSAVPVTSSLTLLQYRLYQYRTVGQRTMLVEVYFNSASGSAGRLFVGNEPSPGVNPCDTAVVAGGSCSSKTKWYIYI
jgi:hypothetical protein